MLTHEENERICRVGSGTIMGRAMRRDWIPALLSSELPDRAGDPIHVELLGENFVAFRDGSGRVGLLDEHCCHRGASLTVGIVEQCGIRCLYHGWLYGADGALIETPNVPNPRFRERVRAKSYPVREAGGMVWAYLGALETMPKLPEFNFMNSVPAKRLNAMAVVGCNYVQVMEGLLDSSHVSVLHKSSLQQMSTSGTSYANTLSHMQYDEAPKIEAEETDFGLHYAAIRNVDGRLEVRVAAYVAPFYNLIANGDLWFAVVPMTDNKTALYHVFYDGVQDYGNEPLSSAQLEITGLEEDILKEYGMTRKTFDTGKRMNRANGWRQDRAAMKAGHFTGVPPFTPEDALVSTSAGEIRDRTREHLSSADIAVAQFYRALLRTVRQVEQGGPPVGNASMSVSGIRGVQSSMTLGSDWRALVPEHRSLTNVKNSQQQLKPADPRS